jgi:hypothetical protein
LNGDNLFVPQANTVRVFALRGPLGRQLPPPTLSKLSLSGLRRGRATLGLQLHAPTPLRIAAITLTLPHGLALAASRRDLLSGVSVNSNRQDVVTVRGGRLLVVFRRLPNEVSFVLKGRALTVAASLMRRYAQLVAKNRLRGRKHAFVMVLQSTINVTDTTTALRRNTSQAVVFDVS